MSAFQETSRLARLAALLAEKRGRITDLLRRIAELGNPDATKPAIFSKFLRLLEEVAGERGEEVDLMHRIEEVEEKHRFHRAHNRLERAHPGHLPKPDESAFENESDGSKEIKYSKGLWHFLAFWRDRSETSTSHKKQDVSLD